MAMEIKMVMFFSTLSIWNTNNFDQSHLGTILSASTEGTLHNYNSCHEFLG